jgi:hypothetical protein
MAEPILVDKDLDALISSDTYIPESGVIEAAAMDLYGNGSLSDTSNFTTFNG